MGRIRVIYRSVRLNQLHVNSRAELLTLMVKVLPFAEMLPSLSGKLMVHCPSSAGSFLAEYAMAFPSYATAIVPKGFWL